MTRDPRTRLDNKPSTWLITHQAPPGLLDRALLRAEPARPARRRPVLAFAAVFGTGLCVGAIGAWTAVGMGDASESSSRAAATKTPDVPAPHMVPVRLMVHAPFAGQVSVAGTFNAWDPGANPMQSVGDGLFRTVLHLPHGQHEYMFVADGTTWLTDDTAPIRRDDGLGHLNAVIEL